MLPFPKVPFEPRNIKNEHHYQYPLRYVNPSEVEVALSHIKSLFVAFVVYLDWILLINNQSCSSINSPGSADVQPRRSLSTITSTWRLKASPQRIKTDDTTV